MSSYCYFAILVDHKNCAFEFEFYKVFPGNVTAILTYAN